MKDHTSIGRIAGVEVSVNWSVLVIALLLTWTLADGYLPQAAPHHTTAAYWIAGVVGAALLIASLLAHEVAHAIVARHHGVGVDGLTLWMFGGIARLNGEAPDAKAEFRIAAIGPAVSLGLGFAFGLTAVCLTALGVDDVVIGTAWWLALINVALAVFNLLPGAPLDGGRVLKAALWRRSGDRVQAAMSAAHAGQTLAYVLIALGVIAVIGGDPLGGVWMVLISMFLMLAARGEYTGAAAGRLVGDLRAMDVMSTPVETGRTDLTVEEFVNHHLLRGHYSSFPLVGSGYSVQGLVGLPQIRSLPRDRWAETRVGDIAVPVDRITICRPTDPLTSIQGTPEAGGRILVVDDGILVGIVSPSDITRALQARAVAEGMPPSFFLAGRP